MTNIIDISDSHIIYERHQNHKCSKCCECKILKDPNQRLIFLSFVGVFIGSVALIIGGLLITETTSVTLLIIYFILFSVLLILSLIILCYKVFCKIYKKCYELDDDNEHIEETLIMDDSMSGIIKKKTETDILVKSNS